MYQMPAAATQSRKTDIAIQLSHLRQERATLDRVAMNLGEKASDSGQTLIEFALVASVFLLLIFSVIDFAYLFYTRATLQNAVRQAGRYAITGQCVNKNGTCTLTRYKSIIQTLENTSIGLLNDANSSDIVIACTNNGGGCPNQAGGPGDTVTITVTYQYKFLTGLMAPLFTGGQYPIKVSASFNNEPFPPGQS